MLIPRAGEQIGDFELIRRIGAGGMGVVYEARQLSTLDTPRDPEHPAQQGADSPPGVSRATDRRVALKILSPAMTREKNRLRFLREAEAAARLHHPNIVSVYAIRQDADLCYYAMEFIDGWPLSRVRELLGEETGSGSFCAQHPSGRSDKMNLTPFPLPEFMRTHADSDAQADPDAATVVEQPGGRASRPPTEGQESPPPAPGRPTPHLAPFGPRGRSVLGDPSYIRQVVVMLRDIARALHYAHSQGVTHRDIKPENLLLDHEGRLHLVDFGLAHVMEQDNITLTGELMGTPLYMSPEQVAAGRIGIDHRTDLYSLAVVMYHLLCLQPPYEAPSREALLRAIMVHSPRPLSSRNPAVPRELEAVVHHAMEKDPDRRYATGAEMADDLDRWLAGKPISIRLPGRMKRWWTGLSRTGRRTLAGGSAAALAVAACLIAFALRTTPPAPAPPQPAEAIKSAQREAATADYFESALWYAEALRRGATPKDVSPLELSLVYNELAPLNQRLALGPGGRPWSLHPTQALCVFVGTDGRMRAWDPTADPAVSDPFGPNPPPRWLSFDLPGKYIWSVDTQAHTDAFQCWTPAGEPALPEPVKTPGRISHLRIVSGKNGYTLAMLTSPPSDPAATGPASPGPLDLAIYHIQPGHAPAPPAQFSDVQLAELSDDGAYLALLSGDDVLRTGPTNGLRRPIGPLGTTALFTFAHASAELALADPSGQITLVDPDPLETGRRLGLLEALALREKTAPAYMRFSPDGKYLLVVGTDTQIIPPYLRSITVMDTRSADMSLCNTFGRDAYFSDDGGTLVWWDDESVTFVPCEASQAAEPPHIDVNVRPRIKMPEGLPDTNLSQQDLLPVRTDARARRMLAIEADGPADHPDAAFRATAWDVQTGERLRLLLSNAQISACDLDATGRFAFAQVGTHHPQLFAWDLGDPDAPYPRSAMLPVQPISPDDLRLTRRPLVAILGQMANRPEWSLTDPATLRPVGAPIPALGTVSRWLVSDDAAVLLQTTYNRLLAWDLRNGTLIRNLDLLDGPDALLALSPSGRTAAIATSNGGLELRDILTAQSKFMKPTSLHERPTQARFSPTGRHIAVADRTGHITICSVEPAAPIVELETGRPVYQMEFCFDDTVLVAGHTAGRASLWSLADGRCIATAGPPAQTDRAPADSGATLPTRVAVRDEPVGTAPPLLATAFANRIEIWPLPHPAAPSTGQPLQLTPAGPPLQTTHGILALAFPPDSHSWQAETLASQAAPLRPSERLLVITDHAAARWFDLPVRSWTPQHWQAHIAAQTGMRLGPDNKPTPTPQ